MSIFKSEIDKKKNFSEELQIHRDEMRKQKIKKGKQIGFVYKNRNK